VLCGDEQERAAMERMIVRVLLPLADRIGDDITRGRCQVCVALLFDETYGTGLTR
jgi:hypothetical protein